MKSFLDYLVEMPVANYQPIGDFSKNSSFRDPRDRMLINNPRSIELVKKKFGNTEHIFNFYFVNSAKANKHTEVGLVDIGWLKTNLGDDVYNAVEKGLDENEDAISVVFTNNKGSERKNLTAWMMAHRIGHALARENGMGGKNFLYKECTNTIISVLSSCMQYYGDEQFPDNERKLTSYGYDEHTAQNSRRNQLAMTYFFQSVCTFRSARENLIRDWFEVVNELLAQYLTTGKIRFNPAPPSFGNKTNGKNAFRRSIRGGEEALSDVNDELNSLANGLTYHFDNLLGAVANKVLVM